MEAHDVLQRMSQLVRERPAITVRELADALGYSQERSVYYWLNKADFRGIRQFRDAVLRGEWGGSAGIRSQAGGYELPLYRMSQLPFDRDQPPPSSRRLVVETPPAPEAFAVEVEGASTPPSSSPRTSWSSTPPASPGTVTWCWSS